MFANQIRPTTLSAAIVFRVHPFLAKKHRELPFLAIALKLMLWRVHLRIYESGSYVARWYPNRSPRMLFIKKLSFYRFNDRGANLLTVDIWEQPNYFSCAARRRTVQEEFRL